jgi:hypothetical protein
VLAVTAYTKTGVDFRNDMDNIYSGLQVYGEKSKNMALDETLMLWMSLVFVNQTKGPERLTLTGNPLIIFNRDHINAALSSISGNCNVSNTATFDNSNGLMTVSWVYKEFIAEPKCMKAMDPMRMGYDMMAKPKMFTLPFDIRSIVTAIAVNLKLITIDQLVEITKYKLDYMNNGRRVIARWFYDPQYAGMQPVRCITSNGGPPFCTFRVNDVSILLYVVSYLIISFLSGRHVPFVSPSWWKHQLSRRMRLYKADSRRAEL